MLPHSCVVRHIVDQRRVGMLDWPFVVSLYWLCACAWVKMRLGCGQAHGGVPQLSPIFICMVGGSKYWCLCAPIPFSWHTVSCFMDGQTRLWLWVVVMTCVALCIHIALNCQVCGPLLLSTMEPVGQILQACPILQLHLHRILAPDQCDLTHWWNSVGCVHLIWPCKADLGGMSRNGGCICSLLQYKE